MESCAAKDCISARRALYAPADWDGWNVFGIGRLGVENWRMKRAVSFNGYNRENSKDWTGFSGSVRAGGGYEADWGTIKAGPSPRWTTPSRRARP